MNGKEPKIIDSLIVHHITPRESENTVLTNMDIMISHYEKIASKMDLKAAKNGNDDKNEPAGESMIFDDNSLDFDIFEEFFK